MKRIKDAMKGVMKQCGFSGTLREFADSLRQDKQHVCSTQAELLAGYQKIMDHVQSKLPSLFYNIPSTPCTLKAMSPEKAKSAPAACVPHVGHGWLRLVHVVRPAAGTTMPVRRTASVQGCSTPTPTTCPHEKSTKWRH